MALKTWLKLCNLKHFRSCAELTFGACRGLEQNHSSTWHGRTNFSANRQGAPSKRFPCCATRNATWTIAAPSLPPLKKTQRILDRTCFLASPAKTTPSNAGQWNNTLENNMPPCHRVDKSVLTLTCDSLWAFEKTDTQRNMGHTSEVSCVNVSSQQTAFEPRQGRSGADTS